MILDHAVAIPLASTPGITRRILVHGPGLMLVEFTFSGRQDLPVHTHPHEQVGYIVSGRLRLNMNGQCHELGPGDSYHVLPNLPHGALIHDSAVVVDAFTPPREDFLTAAIANPNIRLCRPADFETIHQIINDAAQAYRGVIPPDCWHDPYMSREELRRQIEQGIIFYGYQHDGQLVGVMGIQHVQEVTLIRHAYVRTSHRQHGIGGQLLACLRGLTQRPVMIGTWADAAWAIRFYQKHGFRLVPREQTPALLNRYWGVPPAPGRNLGRADGVVLHRWRNNGRVRVAFPFPSIWWRPSCSPSLPSRSTSAFSCLCCYAYHGCRDGDAVCYSSVGPRRRRPHIL